MSRMRRLSDAMFSFHEVSGALINAMIDRMPEEIFASEDIQQAMLSYMEATSKWQTSAAMFVASAEETANG